MITIPQIDLVDLLALSSTPLLLLEQTGQVIYINHAAVRFFTEMEMLRIDSGLLIARRKGEDRDIRNSLAGLSANHPTDIVCLRNRVGIPVLVLDMHRVQSGRIALRLAEVGLRPAPSAARLKTLFGLTRAEARVATALLSGLGIQNVGREHGVEPETVRTQVKHIRSKTGARSQNQLLGILAAAGSDLVTPERGQPMQHDYRIDVGRSSSLVEDWLRMA